VFFKIVVIFFITRLAFPLSLTATESEAKAVSLERNGVKSLDQQYYLIYT